MGVDVEYLRKHSKKRRTLSVNWCWGEEGTGGRGGIASGKPGCKKHFIRMGAGWGLASGQQCAP